MILFVGLYTGPGSDYAIDACNVCPNDIDNGHYDVNDGFDQAGEACCYLPIGSVIVRPGCQIYLYEVLKCTKIFLHNFCLQFFFNA